MVFYLCALLNLVGLHLLKYTVCEVFACLALYVCDGRINGWKMIGRVEEKGDYVSKSEGSLLFS